MRSIGRHKCDDQQARDDCYAQKQPLRPSYDTHEEDDPKSDCDEQTSGGHEDVHLEVSGCEATRLFKRSAISLEPFLARSCLNLRMSSKQSKWFSPMVLAAMF